MEKVYLDANASTRVHPEVLSETERVLSSVWGNPSSVHARGREAKKHLDTARRRVAELINAESPSEVIFTSGGTESDNTAISGVLPGNLREVHVVTSAVEHKAVLNTCRYLESRGAKVTYVGVDARGLPDIAGLESAIGKKTVLISVMAANNETGVLMPIERIGEIAREKRVLFHTDAVQAAGKIPFDAGKVKADLVSLSAHKLNGPKGAGALYIRKGLGLRALFQGGDQENRIRPGTENVPAIAGFGKACEIARKRLAGNSRVLEELRDKLYNGMIEKGIDATLNGGRGEILPNTLNVSFPGLDGEDVVRSLDLEGICVSTGSACSSGAPEMSHVLRAMGLSDERVRGAVRFSLDVFNTPGEIDTVIAALRKVIGRLRG